MSTVHYEIVEHDGGWAYKAEGTFSETFPTRDAAVKAAHLAAGEQRLSGEDTGIVYEDSDGRWRGEVSSGNDRPATEVDD